MKPKKFNLQPKRLKLVPKKKKIKTSAENIKTRSKENKKWTDWDHCFVVNEYVCQVVFLWKTTWQTYILDTHIRYTVRS